MAGKIFDFPCHFTQFMYNRIYSFLVKLAILPSGQWVGADNQPARSIALFFKAYQLANIAEAVAAHNLIDTILPVLQSIQIRDWSIWSRRVEQQMAADRDHFNIVPYATIGAEIGIDVFWCRFHRLKLVVMCNEIIDRLPDFVGDVG